MNWLAAGFVVYAVTLIITTSHLAEGFRIGFRRLAWKLLMPEHRSLFVRKWYFKGLKEWSLSEVDPDDEGDDYIHSGFDFISCSMCVGVWVAALLCLWHMSLWDTVAAYGFSYFLKTQERP